MFNTGKEVTEVTETDSPPRLAPGEELVEYLMPHTAEIGGNERSGCMAILPFFGLKPSRTYSIAMTGILAQLALAAGGVLVAIFAPEVVGEVVKLLGTLSVTLAGGAVAGSGSMAVRDYSSGGLTSSQGDVVMESRREGL